MVVIFRLRDFEEEVTHENLAATWALITNHSLMEGLFEVNPGMCSVIQSSGTRPIGLLVVRAHELESIF